MDSAADGGGEPPTAKDFGGWLLDHTFEGIVMQGRDGGTVAPVRAGVQIPLS